jgi:hypothetical protein
LSALFTGENPFEAKAKIAPVDEEEVKIEDVPF